MVIEKKGNILDCEERFMVQQVNCCGVMGSGLALQIKTKYPEVEECYKRYCEKFTDKLERLGKCNIVCCEDGVYVGNLFGQVEYGRDKSVIYTDFSALFEAIKEVCSYANALGFSKIAVPYKLGCGLANGNWEHVYAALVVISELKYIDFVIYNNN